MGKAVFSILFLVIPFSSIAEPAAISASQFSLATVDSLDEVRAEITEYQTWFDGHCSKWHVFKPRDLCARVKLKISSLGIEMKEIIDEMNQQLERVYGAEFQRQFPDFFDQLAIYIANAYRNECEDAEMCQVVGEGIEKYIGLLQELHQTLSKGTSTDPSVLAKLIQDFQGEALDLKAAYPYLSEANFRYGNLLEYPIKSRLEGIWRLAGFPKLKRVR